MTGTTAPPAKARNEPPAAPSGEPSWSGIEAELLADERVEGRLGVLEDAMGDRPRLGLGEALRTVDRRQLGFFLLGHRLELGPFEGDLTLVQLALALHRDVLTGGHAERAGEEPRDTGQEDEVGVGTVRRPRP